MTFEPAVLGGKLVFGGSEKEGKEKEGGLH